MRRTEPNLTNERGGALLVALVLVGMLTIVGIMAVSNSTNDIDLVYNKIHSEAAFYVAQAAGLKALSELNADKTWRDGYGYTPFGNGTFTVALTDSTADSALVDTVLLLASGLVEGARSQLQFEVAPKIFRPFRWAMFADEGIDVRNSMRTDSFNSDSGAYATTRMDDEADVGSNGKVIIDNGGFIGGDVMSATEGGTDVHAGATVIGDISDQAPEEELPAVPQADFDDALVNTVANDSISGSYTYDTLTHAFSSEGTVTLGSGVYYFSSITLFNSADMVLAPNAEVTIYVTGDIEMKNSAKINDSGDAGDLVFYSQGDITLKNSGDIRAVFYSPTGSVDLRNSGEFYGSIVANDIVNHNSALFHYDRSLADIILGDVGDYEVVAFLEL